MTRGARLKLLATLPPRGASFIAKMTSCDEDSDYGRMTKVSCVDAIAVRRMHFVIPKPENWGRCMADELIEGR